MASTDPPIGALVGIPAGRGLVRFCGTTSFAPGRWVGIELEQEAGKNDGTINGVSYFRCRPNYGVFVRPSQVTTIEAHPEPPKPTLPTAVRPGLNHKRTSSIGLARPPSTPRYPSSPRAGSPAKPGPSALGTSSSVPSVVSRSGASSPAKRQRLPSLVTVPQKTLTRSSTLQDVSLSPRIPTSALGGRRTDSPIQEPAVVRTPATPAYKGSGIPPPSVSPRAPSPRSTSALLPPVSPLAAHVQPVKPPSRPPSVQNNRIQDDTELQELRAKVRVLEAKRADDARHVRELETRLSEAESFVALRPKLQAKLTAQQTEIITARRDLADAKQLAELADSRVFDAQEQLEMAALDKEVAEERAETAELELEELKERLAVVEVELQVMKEGGGGEDGGDSSVKMTLPYIQLEKQNERLKEALVRLRDISQETDQEQKRRLADMEKDIMGIDELQTQYDSTLIKLANAEVQIEDLKLQLDDALGAEDLLVQLTERNLMLGEKIEEMRITIEDLEALKELNDELEENHIETEKALQEEIDRKALEIHASLRKIEGLEEACLDLEGTIGQFRELVLQLQAELDMLRAQTQHAQNESATAVSQSAAMMSLTLKLQSSASKNQAKNIELEIKRIESREAQELLAIVQPYLPQLYVETDSDATNCYMLFQRLAFKADLINTVVGQAHGLPESLTGPVSDVLVGICEMRIRVSSLSTLCKRFAAILRRCDPQSFLNIGRIFPEIAPMEKRIDMHIDLLRRDEFREMECVQDVQNIQAQCDHLAEKYFNAFDHDLGERELGYACSLDHDLDMFTAAIGLTKTSITTLTKDDEVVLDMAGLNIEEELFEPLQAVLDQTKSAKALSKKLAKRLDDLVHDSTALKAHLIPRLNALNDLGPQLSNFAISLAQEVMPHVADARSAKSPFQLQKVLAFVRQTAASTVGKGRKDGVTSWDAVADVVAQLVREINELLPLAMEAENVLKITGKAPWVVRIDEVKASTMVNLEAERKAAQLGDELQGLARSLKAKDQSIQEASVKIEHMERKMETVKKQADAITDLEGELGKARKQERAYEEAMEQLQSDLDVLEQDNAKLKAAASHPERQVSEVQRTETETVAVEGSMETSYLLEQLEALRGTVRFLRTENSYLKGQDLMREIQALPPLPEPAPRLATPPLDRSTLSDSDSDDDSESDKPATPPTLRSLATETKYLYRDVIRFSSTPRVVDLSAINAKRVELGGGSKGWMPRSKTPAHQVLERKIQGEKLSRRVKGLLERTSGL